MVLKCSKGNQAGLDKPDRMVGPQIFSGKATLASALTEAIVVSKPDLATGFALVPDQLLGNMTSERELSDAIGTSMRIIPARSLNASIGMDAADRFIEAAERNIEKGDDGSKR